MNRVEWMKGICHLWSRGRLISPSMPVGDDWYLNLNSKKRPPGRNLGEHRSVRRSGTTSRGTVVLEFCLRMRSFLKIEVHTRFLGKSVRVGSTEEEELFTVGSQAGLVNTNHAFHPCLYCKFCTWVKLKSISTSLRGFTPGTPE